MCLCSPSSINLYWRRLGVKWTLHATHKPHVRGLAASAGVWLRAIETEISAALWTTGPREGLSFLNCILVRSVLRTGHTELEDEPQVLLLAASEAAVGGTSEA